MTDFNTGAGFRSQLEEFCSGFIDKSNNFNNPVFNFFLNGKTTKSFDNPGYALNNMVDVF